MNRDKRIMANGYTALWVTFVLSFNTCPSYY